ncbi:hypothetical protein [Streptomyces sp. NPDC093984]|uniref:hypothetical protein n=1 Tax=Streptomyces sp. NPDC093984 TaxID=3366052 RepID=UPI00381713A4
MTTKNSHGDSPGQNQPPVKEAGPGPRTFSEITTADEHVVEDIAAAIVTPTAIAAGIKYGLQSVNNLVTQRAETQREQIRQDGETARAIIAAQMPQASPPESAQASPPESPQQ